MFTDVDRQTDRRTDMGRQFATFKNVYTNPNRLPMYSPKIGINFTATGEVLKQIATK